jgi:hypothetical protein
MLRIKKIFLIISTTAILAIVLAGYFSYQLYISKKDPQVTIQKETSDLVDKISKLIVLPEGETPTIATVSDPEALKDQIFFAQAQKGDKVLIYAQAKKAILYSVTLNKILEVAPLNIGDKTIKNNPPEPTKKEEN